MNKKSRKYRKLQFIRKKNTVRLGKDLQIVVKVSRYYHTENMDLLPNIITNLIAAEERLLKLPLMCKAIAMSYVGDDFIKDLQTLKITTRHV